MAGLVLLLGCQPAVRRVDAQPQHASANPCEQGDLGACTALAEKEEDEGRREALLHRACQGGHGPGCFALAQHGEDRQALLERACELGDGRGCEALGLEALGREPARGYELLIKGCGLGAGGACNEAGYQRTLNRAVRRDVAEALSLFEKGCAAKNATACYNAGALVEGEPKLGGADRAFSSLQRACELDHADACGAGARLARVKGDPSAKALAKRGCDLGNAMACDLVERIASTPLLQKAIANQQSYPLMDGERPPEAALQGRWSIDCAETAAARQDTAFEQECKAGLHEVDLHFEQSLFAIEMRRNRGMPTRISGSLEIRDDKLWASGRSEEWKIIGRGDRMGLSSVHHGVFILKKVSGR